VICAFAACVTPRATIADTMQGIDLTIRHGIIAGLLWRGRRN
jgi:hypothetical protein